MTRLVATVVAFGLVATACGPDPIERYFDEVQSITRIMQRESIAALPDPATIDRESILGVNGARATAVEALTTLVAPREVAPEHQALLLALSDLTSAGDAFLAATADLDADEFAAALLGSAELDEVAARVAAACATLERRAIDLEYSNRFSC